MFDLTLVSLQDINFEIGSFNWHNIQIHMCYQHLERNFLNADNGIPIMKHEYIFILNIYLIHSHIDLMFFFFSEIDSNGENIIYHQKVIY